MVGWGVTLDVDDMLRAAGVLDRASNRTPDAVRRAINRTGDQAFTVVKRVVARQMGIRVGVAADQMRRKRASYESLSYVIGARGGYLSLKYFAARQTRRGVSAAPWNVRRVFPHTFIVGKLGGHVFSRTSKKRFPLEKKWGPALPNELVKGETAKAFTETVATVLPRRLEHELGRILAGAD